MRISLIRRLAFATIIVAAGSCAPYRADPRFGSLPAGPRPFSFAHNIELLEVSNGLRIALIRDDRTNLATVDMRYEVGSTEDPAGKAGLAHLVEHLVFMIRDGSGPTLFEQLGEIALSYNAYTTEDETHYTATVPVEMLDRAIAIEGQRMRASCDQLDEATFQRERDVVLAEEAQRSGDFDKVWLEVNAAVYGKDHAYARPVGSKEVTTVTRADACAFIAQYYAPSRAILVISGPFDPARIKKLVGSTFGPIGRKAKPRLVADPLTLEGSRSRHTAPVDRPIAMVVFPRPAWGGDVGYSVGEVRLRSVMADADNDHPWITDTAVYQIGGPRAPAIVVQVEVNSEAKLDAAVAEVFTRSRTLFDGLTPRQLARIIGGLELSLVARWDDLDSRGGWIADFLQYTDHHWFMLAEMRAMVERNWDLAGDELAGILTEEGAHVATILPSGEDAGSMLGKAVPAGSHDQVPWHAPVDEAEADQPLAVTRDPRRRVERYELDNGLNVELAPDIRSPIVDVRLIFPAGSAHEPPDRYGLAIAAAYLLDNDYERTYEARLADKLNWALARGTEISYSVTETATTFTATGMSQWADWHAWYLSWLIDQGQYNQVDLDRMRERAREIAVNADTEDGVDHPLLAFGTRLYGKGHPYASPAPEVGAAFLRLGAKDLDRWKRQHYRARGATLVVSGSFDIAVMKRTIAELYGPWSGGDRAELPPVPAAHPAKGPSWLAADDATLAQAQVRIGFAAQSDAVEDGAARMVLKEMITDGLRVVREGMGASYGVYAMYDQGAAGTALLVGGAVDEGKAGEALRRILAVVTGLRDNAAGERDVFVRARRKALALALARSGGASSVATQLGALAALHLPPDYNDKLAQAIATLTPAQLAEVAAADLAEGRMVVMVRGKTAVIDAAFAAVSVTPERVRY